MIQKRFRFHGYGSLKYLFSKGQAAHSRNLTIKFVANTRRKNPRYTIIVSKKVHKSAVVRNRIRRRLYELIRLNQPTINPLYDVAIIVKSNSTATCSSQELAQQFQATVLRAGINIS